MSATNDFLCPKCKGHLRVGDTVVFAAKLKDGKIGLILLSPQIGNYSVMNHSSLNINMGESVEFLCPICHSNLAVDEIDSKLARVIMVDENKDEYEILFSRTFGERATYKIRNRKVEAYGENANKYLNFLNLSHNK